MRWHFLVSSAAGGAHNMALDEGLMRLAARSGDAVFRVYGWTSPTLSIGRNQRARGCYNLADALAMGVGFVRRPTGGRALLHHREITYSVTLPIRDADGARGTYDFVNQVLVAGLRHLGVRASRAAETVSIPPGLRPCFDVPARHEIVVGRRKLVGSAQWRHAGALLQHGSILVQDDQALIGRLMREPAAVAPLAATLADALGREPSLEEVAAELRIALAEATGAPVMDFVADAVLPHEVDRLKLSYQDDAWTWRR
jgi:lipoyl(octanoyl) transferase